jgi:hypothetical protein
MFVMRRVILALEQESEPGVLQGAPRCSVFESCYLPERIEPSMQVACSCCAMQ